MWSQADRVIQDTDKALARFMRICASYGCRIASISKLPHGHIFVRVEVPWNEYKAWDNEISKRPETKPKPKRKAPKKCPYR